MHTDARRTAVARTMAGERTRAATTRVRERSMAVRTEDAGTPGALAE